MSKPVKVLFTGPESCGKTTLSRWLHEVTGWHLIPEVARAYLTEFGPEYTENDVLSMSRLQWDSEYQAILRGENYICDTDLLTFVIWQEERFGKVDTWIENTWQSTAPDVCFLCMPDIPWVSDPLRENPLDRDRLAKLYCRTLDTCKISYIPLEGKLSQRQKTILSTLQDSNTHGWDL